MADSPMSPIWRYNADIIGTTCRRCGSTSGNRCKGPRGPMILTPAHMERVRDAGYDWDKTRGALVRRGN